MGGLLSNACGAKSPSMVQVSIVVAGKGEVLCKKGIDTTVTQTMFFELLQWDFQYTNEEWYMIQGLIVDDVVRLKKDALRTKTVADWGIKENSVVQVVGKKVVTI